MLTILDPVELQYCAKRVETLIIKEGFSVSESCIFLIRDGNDFSQFGQTEVNETQGYATYSLQIIHYFIHYADANQSYWGLPFHHMSSSVADKSHVHTRIEQYDFKIIFQDLIR